MELAGRLLRYARTVRPLRPSQLIYWPLRRIQRLWHVRPAPGAAAAPQWKGPLAREVAAWGPGDAGARLGRAEEITAGRFHFLNQTAVLPVPEWQRQYGTRLWTYHLHYFDYALDLAWACRVSGEPRFAQRFEELALGWLAGTEGGMGAGWEPYPVSVRIVNWIYAILLLEDRLEPATVHRLTASLVTQHAFLAGRLERHLLANHLLKNLQAMVLGELALHGTGAAGGGDWARELWSEVLEQVLPDGGHFERSPMYHAQVLGGLLETVASVRAAGGDAPAEVVDRLRGMVRATGLLTRPDGTVHLFNDSAQRASPPRASLDALAERVLQERISDPQGSFALSQTGYFGYSSPSDGERLIIDCGPPGPTYQPGHAHCDLLSFELDLAGRPVVVDSGVSGYEEDSLREYVRSTRAHNTVRIGGKEQSEIWGVFRMARRAQVVSADATGAGPGYRFSGAYLPYYDRRTTHRRSFIRERGGWLVTDRVEGAAGATVESFLHLHPDLSIQSRGPGFLATWAEGKDALIVEPFGFDHSRVLRGETDPVQGWYCAEFGLRVPGSVLVFGIDHNDGREFGYRLRVADSPA